MPNWTKRARPSGRWISLWLWMPAAAISVAALVVAIVERPHPGGATLRPMAASESMSDPEAYAVAANTVRVWLRERDAGRLLNVQALSCPETHDGILGGEIDALKSKESFFPKPVTAVARFTRNGPEWTLDVFHPESSEMFTLQVRNGELLVCQIGPAPVP